MKINKYDFTKGSIYKNTLRLALPMMTSIIFHDLFNIVDMFFVGKLGPAAVAAVSISGLLIHVIIIAAVGIATGTVAMIAIYIGAKELYKAENVAVQAIFMGIFISIIIGILGYLFAETILKLLGAGKDVLLMGVKYIRISSVGAIFILLAIILSAALRGAGDAVTPMKILILSTIINIILDPLLIFGIWKFPKLGVAGSALATVIARMVSVLLLLHVFLGGHSYFHLKLNKFVIDIRIMWKMFRIGIFGSLQMLIRNISNLFIIKIISLYGTFAVAAFGINIRLIMLIQMFGVGIGNASATLVGQNLGAGKPDRAEKSAFVATGFYELIIVLIGCIFFIFPEKIIEIFNRHPQVVQIGSVCLRILLTSFVFVAL
ncbi:MAG: MATE family efflux transporter, partial [Candidatus Cloacimonetes bacterium]|nr:MATE family efflux transporter [Candidatus Cloacimonadota bacterium]